MAGSSSDNRAPLRSRLPAHHGAGCDSRRFRVGVEQYSNAIERRRNSCGASAALNLRTDSAIRELLGSSSSLTAIAAYCVNQCFLGLARFLGAECSRNIFALFLLDLLQTLRRGVPESKASVQAGSNDLIDAQSSAAASISSLGTGAGVADRSLTLATGYKRRKNCLEAIIILMKDRLNVRVTAHWIVRPRRH